MRRSYCGGSDTELDAFHGLCHAQAAYYKRWKWAPIKSRRVVVDAVN